MKVLLLLIMLMSAPVALAEASPDLPGEEPAQGSTVTPGTADLAPVEQPAFRLKDEREHTGESNSSGDVGTMLMGLTAVLGVIFLLAWLSKRFNIAAPGGGGNMRMISAMSMGQKEKIVLVEVEGQKLLLGVTPNQISCLKELGRSEEAGTASVNGVATKTEFSERISSLLKAEVSGND